MTKILLSKIFLLHLPQVVSPLALALFIGNNGHIPGQYYTGAPWRKMKKMASIVDCVLKEESNRNGRSWAAISIKDDIGEYSVKWEGKWAEENWGCWYIGTTRRLFLSLSGSNPFFFIHFAKFRSSSKIAGMNSLRNAISQGAAGDSWVILICHLHSHPVHPHPVHWNTETLTHCDTETHLHAYTGITHLHMSLPLWHAHITSWTGKISHLPNSRCIFPHTLHQTRPHAK